MPAGPKRAVNLSELPFSPPDRKSTLAAALRLNKLLTGREVVTAYRSNAQK
jgi:hypothetical protein